MNIQIPSDKIVFRHDYKIIKRLIDIVGSFLLIILFIPIYIIIAIIIKISSKGAILYDWHLVGKNGVPFTSWKSKIKLKDGINSVYKWFINND